MYIYLHDNNSQVNPEENNKTKVNMFKFEHTHTNSDFIGPQWHPKPRSFSIKTFPLLHMCFPGVLFNI